jgi:glutamate-1-semialdehyde aminotransferase
MSTRCATLRGRTEGAGVGSGAMARKGEVMQLFKGLDADDSTYRALSLILEAWDEGTESGVPNEQMAYAALFTALTDLVSQFGEEAVVKLAEGLEKRIRVGEFTLHRTRQ